jgi:hypothetical protein
MDRRGFLTGLVAVVAAPFVIRTPGLLMPVRALPPDITIAAVDATADIVTTNVIGTYNYYVRALSSTTVQFADTVEEFAIGPKGTLTYKTHIWNLG